MPNSRHIFCEIRWIIFISLEMTDGSQTNVLNYSILMLPFSSCLHPAQNACIFWEPVVSYTCILCIPNEVQFSWLSLPRQQKKGNQCSLKSQLWVKEHIRGQSWRKVMTEKKQHRLKSKHCWIILCSIAPIFESWQN